MSSKLGSWLFLTILFTGFGNVALLSAQSSTHKTPFDSVYYHIATTLAAQNGEQAIEQATLLLNQSADSLQKVRSLMLLATLNKRTGKHTEALLFAVNAAHLAGKINNTEWHLRISGFLSTTFRELGLIAEGKKYIEEADKANTGTSSSPLIQMFVHQEKAYYEIADKNYTKALGEVNLALELLGGAPDSQAKHIFLATCYQLAGNCNLQLNNIMVAEDYLNKALQTLEGQDSELKGFVYQNLGELALKQGSANEAIKYLQMALDYAASSDNFNLKISTYKSLQSYYLLKGDKEKAISFQSDYMKLMEKQSLLTKAVSNALIEKFDYELGKTATKNIILYVTCLALLGTVICFVGYTAWLQKKERTKYLVYIDKLNYQKAASVLHANHTDSAFSATTTFTYNDSPYIFTDNKLKGSNTILQHEGEAELVEEELQESAVDEKRTVYNIPKETEDRILSQLLTLEQGKFYLENDINLSYLAATLKINSKYLSLIINRHKGKDFNNYINELRINYIIDKLQHNAAYTSYKIAYLAQESGFSTHSKFTTAFKNVTGISPSAFISNLKKDSIG